MKRPMYAYVLLLSVQTIRIVYHIIRVCTSTPLRVHEVRFDASIIQDHDIEFLSFNVTRENKMIQQEYSSTKGVAHFASHSSC